MLVPENHKFSHDLNSLKISVDNKKTNELTPMMSLMDQNALQPQDILCFELERLQGSTQSFLWAYYSLLYINNLQLMQSVCMCSLWIFGRYSGNWRKSQEQKQTSSDITL